MPNIDQSACAHHPVGTQDMCDPATVSPAGQRNHCTHSQYMSHGKMHSRQVSGRMLGSDLVRGHRRCLFNQPYPELDTVRT